MIVIKITSQSIQTSGDNYGANYTDIQEIEFIEIASQLPTHSLADGMGL